MNPKLILFCCAALLLTHVHIDTAAADKGPKYPFSEIDLNLIKNSNAIVREDVVDFEVIDLGKGRETVKMAITIMNNKADHFAEVRIGYKTGMIKITSLEGRVYDKSGRLVEQLKNKDIDDYSSYSGYTSYSDARVKYFDLRYPDYPYTVEYEYTKEYDGLLVFPSWVPCPTFNVASQKSSFKITAPDGYNVRYIELNMEPSAKEKLLDGKKIVSWKFGAFEAMVREPRMPSFRKISPTILAAPSEFETGGYQGNMEDWKSFGMWFKKLNNGRDNLPAEFAAEVSELVADQPSRTEKIRTIYEYLQANTRYVSIQLGIGGWQTFPATDVVSNGYGDCKALTNFTKSMLKAVGIESYNALVNSGSGAPAMIKEFPSNQFDHVILCVPNYQDTIWLECTSQDNPFGYLGSFTGDRHVLVINEDGGTVAMTKNYDQKDNRQHQTVNVVLAENGSAEINATTVCTGRQYDRFDQLLDIGESEQKKWLYKNLDLPSFDLVEFKFASQESFIPELSADIEVYISRFASVSGRRLFFQPNVYNKSYSISIPQKERKYDFVLTYPYEDIDTVKFSIPEGYHMEYLPEKKLIESPFGQYESQVISEEGTVWYIRKQSMVKGTFAPEQYLDFVKFVNKIAEADKSKLVLVKST